MSHMYPEGSPVSYEDQSHIGKDEDEEECRSCHKIECVCDKGEKL